MGCGSSVAVLPTEGSVLYDQERKGNGCVKSSGSIDSGVGYELGSKESTRSEDDLLPGNKYAPVYPNAILNTIIAICFLVNVCLAPPTPSERTVTRSD